MKTHYRATKHIDDFDGLEKRFNKDTSGHDTYEFKFNTSVHLSVSTFNHHTIKSIFTQAFTKQQLKATHQADQHKNVCRADSYRCGQVYQTNSWINTTSKTFMTSGPMQSYTLKSIGFCTHIVKDQWHIELFYHHPSNKNPVVLNIHVRPHFNPSIDAHYSTKQLKDSILSVLPKAHTKLNNYMAELKNITLSNYMQSGYKLFDYTHKGHTTPTVTYDNSDSINIIIKQIQSLDLDIKNKNEFLVALESVENSKDLFPEEIDTLKQQISQCKQSKAIHQKAETQLKQYNPNRFFQPTQSYAKTVCQQSNQTLTS